MSTSKAVTVPAVKPFRYAPGDAVRMKRHPSITWIVLRCYRMSDGEAIYAVRHVDDPNDTRGALAADEALS